MVGVVTDVAFLQGQAALSSSRAQANESMQRISTGYRINGSADDAAGVAIASRLTSTTMALEQSIRNASDAQGMLSTAEGGMIEIENILQRMRELSVQAANDTNDSNDRGMIAVEMDQLVAEIDRIAASTTWAGQVLFNGSTQLPTLASASTDTKTLEFMVGSTGAASDVITVDLRAVTAEALGVKGTPKAPTMSKYVTDAASVSAVSATATSTSGTVKISSGFNASDTYSVKINGTQISITATDADGFDNTTAGLNQQLAAQINLEAGAVGAPPTTSVKGFHAVYDAANDEVDITYSAPVVSVADDTAPLTPTISYDGSTGVLTQTDETSDATVTINGVDVDIDAVASPYTADLIGWGASAKAAIEAAVTGVNVVDNGDGTLNISSNLLITDLASTSSATSPDITISGTTVTVTGSPSTGDTLTLTIDGRDVSITVGNDGYSDDVAGVAAQMIDAINALELPGISVTDTDPTDGAFDVQKGGAVDVSSNSAARASMETISDALILINEMRADLGAVINRLDSSISNLTNVSQNTQISRGAIQDADMAEETSKLTAAQILEQASTAMMAKANASKENVLTLLR